ncbi:MAG: amidohydrolase family protein [Acidimicrobiales bacterium]|nr:amidohydrolase family protein [Acidimicrobiales bacterium]
MSGLPEVLEGLDGELLDVDSHEMLPAELWVDAFGDIAAPVAQRFIESRSADDPGYWSVPGCTADSAPVDPTTIWAAKGPTAPGAIDPARRVEVIDAFGVRRQLMFPTSIGHCGAFISTYPAGAGQFDGVRFEHLAADRRSYAQRLFAAWNAWAAERAVGDDRIRPVFVLYGDTPRELIDTTERAIAAGARATVLLSGEPPAGRSPAHPDLDPFYELLAANDVTLTVHLGSEGGFVASTTWRDAPAYDGFKVSGEFTGDPWTRASMHLAAQNLTMTLITGGVFDRHPSLRFGVIELGAHWVGPLAELLDLWADNTRSISRDAVRPSDLERRPSDYLRTNVRVTPFVFEPVGRYLDRYDLADVLCFSTDYPHVEGGRDPVGVFAGELERHGSDVIEKFFVTNGRLLLPD